MTPLKTFWVEKLPVEDWEYTAEAQGPCGVHGERHHASSGLIEWSGEGGPGLIGAPATCSCGYVFSGGYQHGSGFPRWKRLDTGEELHGRKLPPGALYASWRGAGPFAPGCGHDGLCVVCVLPTGDHWRIDSRASNCDQKADNTHRCWVRHGTFGEVVHVDKNGLTCGAGAGSIIVDNWHGFLHNGHLVQC
jgi:hypothetical protein